MRPITMMTTCLWLVAQLQNVDVRDNVLDDDNEGGEDNSDDEDLQRENMTPEEKAENAASALKKLGNVKKKKLHEKATIDLFEEGNRLLTKTLAKTRRKVKQREHRKLQLILMSIRYYETQMQYRRTILKTRVLKLKNGTLSFTNRSWENDYKDIMKVRRQRGSNRVKK